MLHKYYTADFRPYSWAVFTAGAALRGVRNLQWCNSAQWGENFQGGIETCPPHSYSHTDYRHDTQIPMPSTRPCEKNQSSLHLRFSVSFRNDHIVSWAPRYIRFHKHTPKLGEVGLYARWNLQCHPGQSYQVLFVERSCYRFRICMAVCVLVCARMPMHVSVCFRVQVLGLCVFVYVCCLVLEETQGH